MKTIRFTVIILVVAGVLAGTGCKKTLDQKPISALAEIILVFSRLPFYILVDHLLQIFNAIIAKRNRCYFLDGGHLQLASNNA